jgi:hypothetical protein
MSMNTSVSQIQINGVDYVRADSLPADKPNGNRAVVVVDRGWIFPIMPEPRLIKYGSVNGDGDGDGNGYGYGYGTCSPHRARRP